MRNHFAYLPSDIAETGSFRLLQPRFKGLRRPRSRAPIIAFAGMVWVTSAADRIAGTRLQRYVYRLGRACKNTSLGDLTDGLEPRVAADATLAELAAEAATGLPRNTRARCSDLAHSGIRDKWGPGLAGGNRSGCTSVVGRTLNRSIGHHAGCHVTSQTRRKKDRWASISIRPRFQECRVGPKAGSHLGACNWRNIDEGHTNAVRRDRDGITRAEGS